jgi:hypothetical protein
MSCDRLINPRSSEPPSLRGRPPLPSPPCLRAQCPPPSARCAARLQATQMRWTWCTSACGACRAASSLTSLPGAKVRQGLPGAWAGRWAAAAAAAALSARGTRHAHVVAGSAATSHMPCAWHGRHVPTMPRLRAILPPAMLCACAGMCSPRLDPSTGPPPSSRLSPLASHTVLRAVAAQATAWRRARGRWSRPQRCHCQPWPSRWRLPGGRGRRRSSAPARPHPGPPSRAARRPALWPGCRRSEAAWATAHAGALRVPGADGCWGQCALG